MLCSVRAITRSWWISGALVNRVGRKWTITLSVVCILLNWVLLLFVRSIPLMYLARIIAGVGGGIIYTVVPMYVAECSEVSQYMVTSL